MNERLDIVAFGEILWPSETFVKRAFARFGGLWDVQQWKNADADGR